MAQNRPEAGNPGESERFQNMLDCLPQMVWTNEADGSQYYSKLWRDFTGLEVGCNDDLDRFEIIHPDDVERARIAWQEAQVTGRYELEYRVRHNSGEYRWIISRGAPVRDDSGSITAWYGTCTDIHDRRLYREALNLSEALNRSMIEASPDPILLVGTDTSIVFMNEASRAEVGEDTAEAAIGQPMVRYFMPGLEEASVAFAEAAQGKRVRFSMKYKGKSGTKWWDVSLAPVLGSNGDPIGILAIGRDITEAKASASKVEELQNQILHGSRLAAMGTMAATLAHELNQPLTAAANFLLAIRHLAGPEHGELVFGVKEAERQVQRAGEIIRRARNMVQNPTVLAQQTSLTRIVDAALLLCRATSNCTPSSTDVQISPDVDAILADPVQTEQVLTNLVRNACQAMEHSDVQRLTIRAVPAGRLCQVEVADTGKGVPTYQDVFQASGSEAVLGLGLALSRTIVERQGGKIWHRPNADGGASFFFTVPRT